jgi:hypothetical protein
VCPPSAFPNAVGVRALSLALGDAAPNASRSPVSASFTPGDHDDEDGSGVTVPNGPGVVSIARAEEVVRTTSSSTPPKPLAPRVPSSLSTHETRCASDVDTDTDADMESSTSASQSSSSSLSSTAPNGDAGVMTYPTNPLSQQTEIDLDLVDDLGV